jgi:hypothetical protein
MTWTPPSTGAKTTIPFVRLPSVGCRTATARVASAPPHTGPAVITITKNAATTRFVQKYFIVDSFVFQLVGEAGPLCGYTAPLAA